MSSPFFGWPVLDAQYFDDRGMALASGGGAGPEDVFRAPLYTWMLGVLYRVAPDDRFFLVEIFQHLLGAFTCLFIYITGREVFNRRAGIAAGLVAAVYGPLMYYEGEILSESLFIFLASGAMAALAAASRDGAPRLLAAGGCLLGLAAVTRPNILPFLPVAALWALFARGGARPAIRVALAAAVAIPALLVVGAVAVRNYAVSGQFVLVAAQGGGNFYIGNNPRADGMPPPTVMVYGSAGRYRDGVQVAAREALRPEGAPGDGGPAGNTNAPEIRPGTGSPGGVPVDDASASGFWYRQAREFIVHNPGKWIGLMARKTLLFWNDYEVRNGKSFYFHKRHVPLLRWLPFPFGAVAVLGLLGFILGFNRQKAAPWSLAALYCCVFSATVILFFVCDRLRLPVVVALIPAAGAGIDAVADAVTASRRRLAVAAALIAVASAAIFPDWFGVRSGKYPQEYWLEGKRLYELGRYDAALSAFGRSAADEPSFPGNHIFMGNCRMQAGDIEKARSCYGEALRLDPGNPRALNGLGVCAERLGDGQKAAEYYTAAMAKPTPGFAKPFVNMANLLVRGKMTDDAAKLLDAALALDREDPEVWLALAVLSSVTGDNAAAQSRRDAAVRLGGPEYGALYDAAAGKRSGN